MLFLASLLFLLGCTSTFADIHGCCEVKHVSGYKSGHYFLKEHRMDVPGYCKDNCVYTNSLGVEFCFKTSSEYSASECKETENMVLGGFNLEPFSFAPTNMYYNVSFTTQEPGDVKFFFDQNAEYLELVFWNDPTAKCCSNGCCNGGCCEVPDFNADEECVACGDQLVFGNDAEMPKCCSNGCCNGGCCTTPVEECVVCGLTSGDHVVGVSMRNESVLGDSPPMIQAYFVSDPNLEPGT